uniref:Lipocalin n=1 Tax=Panagrellus redivivus TaxID=6233 RepID=A0A7E4ZY34_PANRE
MICPIVLLPKASQKFQSRTTVILTVVESNAELCDTVKKFYNHKQTALEMNAKITSNYNCFILQDAFLRFEVITNNDSVRWVANNQGDVDRRRVTFSWQPGSYHYVRE